MWELVLGSLVFSVGYVVPGVAIALAGVLPRGAGVLLAVGGLLAAFAPPIGVQAVIVVGHALFGLLWPGYALRSTAAREWPSGG